MMVMGNKVFYGGLRNGQRRVLGSGLALALLAGLAGCAGQHTRQQVAHPAIQSFAGAPSGDTGTPDGQVKTNLPSAPVDTPLCGTALHEQASTGASLYGRSLESGNSCTRNACFQPLTGTFIAQDGINSVCR